MECKVLLQWFAFREVVFDDFVDKSFRTRESLINKHAKSYFVIFKHFQNFWLAYLFFS